MIDSGEPNVVYIPLPLLHEFNSMMRTDAEPDVASMFGADVAREASKDVSFGGRVDFILLGQMLGQVDECTQIEAGMYLALDQARLFVKMLANPEMSCVSLRYILGCSIDGDEEMVQAWGEKLP
jgi:hypothetical protein